MGKNDLHIDRNQLDVELEQQPMLFLEVSEKLAFSVSRRDALKDEVARVRAEVDAEIRMKHTTGRLTEAAIENQIILDQRYTAVRREYLEAVYQADTDAAVKEAFHQRSYVLKDLAQLFVAGYWSVNSVKNSTTDNASYQQTREVLRQDRQTRVRV